jgi:hypothetical protein
MAYISLPRKETNEGKACLVPSDGIMTVKSSAATNLVIKYDNVSQTINSSDVIASACLTYTFIINEVGETMTRDEIVDAMVAAASIAGGGNGPAIPADLKGNSITSLTISMGAL